MLHKFKIEYKDFKFTARTIKNDKGQKIGCRVWRKK